ncbi:hypothetical protein BGX27_001069 [Mortierella sp. AM989]|nr:hypothetical protein BGX27_001069 [Mortierella sp. AM989]
MSSETASWPPVSSFPPADADSIPISLPSLTATTNTLEDNGAHTPARKSSVSTVDLDKKIPTAEPNLQSITYQAQKPPLHTSDTTLKHSRAASTSREERISESESNRAGTRAISTDINAGRNQQQLAATSAVQQVERPTGNPRCIVRIDRDHNLGDEATRFECEQFPQEFIDRGIKSTN